MESKIEEIPEGATHYKIIRMCSPKMEQDCFVAVTTNLGIFYASTIPVQAYHFLRASYMLKSWGPGTYKTIWYSIINGVIKEILMETPVTISTETIESETARVVSTLN